MTSRHDFTAENVRMVRTTLRLTQAQFAEKLGVSRRTVIRWEQGEHLPPDQRSKRRRNNRHNREKFIRFWKKYEGWLNHVNARTESVH